MNSPTKSTLEIAMRQVCCVTFAVLAIILLASTTSTAQGLKKGIGVDLAASSNSAPMPEADNENAFIVAITDNGTVYLGVNQITLPDLKEKVRSTRFKRGQKLYIKADARTPYAKVLQVLDATRTGGIAPQVLLTAHSESSTSGTIVPPEGVEVQLGPPLQNPR